MSRRSAADNRRLHFNAHGEHCLEFSYRHRADLIDYLHRRGLEEYAQNHAPDTFGVDRSRPSVASGSRGIRKYHLCSDCIDRSGEEQPESKSLFPAEKQEKRDIHSSAGSNESLCRGWDQTSTGRENRGRYGFPSAQIRAQRRTNLD